MNRLYYWIDSNSKNELCVIPPIEGATGWGVWIRRQKSENVEPVTINKGLIKEYWRLDKSLMHSLNRRCVEMGWSRVFGKPPYMNKEDTERESIQEDLPYHFLFITSDAPKAVASAAFKALAKMYHPDQYRNQENEKDMALAMQRVANAKAVIWKNKNW